MSYLPQDVVVLPPLPAWPERWVLYNLFARTALGVSPAVLALLSAPNADGNAADTRYTIWDIARFSHEDGTLADPTRFHRNPAAWRERSLDLAGVLALLREQLLLVDDEAVYRERFGAKRHLLDRQHLGNFHQQIGQHVLTQRRQTASEWWLWQKFQPGWGDVRRDNLYGAVQYPYLKRYFARRSQPGMAVLDVGCGVGIYANLMAGCGAQVLGVDPSAEYIAIAERHAVPGARFACLPIGQPGSLDTVATASQDAVFISDTLLFYFVPIPGHQADLAWLLGELRRVLKPGGLLTIVEPHPMFYLHPWLGDPDRPFTVLTEYRQRRFLTTPTLRDLLQALTGGGFVLTWLDELYADPDACAEVAPRASGFATEFPLWYLLELRPDAHS